MTRAPSIGWQLVLADLSLILFLTTATALSDKHERGSDEATSPVYPGEGSSAASLYLATGGDTAFADWLTAQPRDPREQMTIRADYSASEREVVMAQIRELTHVAGEAGFRPRVILEPTRDTRITVSFAFDTGPAAALNMAQLLQGTGADTSAPGEK
jgi:hypothetical protein